VNVIEEFVTYQPVAVILAGEPLDVAALVL
jgi:hypothetical protein